MTATVLSGTSGALYYTPAGTSVTTLVASAFPATGSNITVGSYLGFKVNDPVTLAYPVGATVTNAIAAGEYFVKTYVAATGVMTISSTAGGTAATATALPSGFGAGFASITYTAPVVVGSVRDWSFEITRAEIDVTTIGQAVGQYAPFRNYISGFADGTGSYIDRVVVSGTVNDTLSRSITVPVILTSASLTVNPDDGQSVAINFRPSEAPTFDLSKS